MGDARKPAPPRRCIFCGGAPISGEHLFPAWMRDYISGTQNDGTSHQVTLEVRTEDGVRVMLDSTGRGPLAQKGDHRSRKLRVVCRTCNSGWMSGLQNKAKPILIPMLTGRLPCLSSAHQEAIAAWAAMFTMVYEFADRRTMVVSQEARQRFKENQKVPRNWMVWIGQFKGGAKDGAAWHRGYRLFSEQEQQNYTGEIFKRDPQMDTQTTVFAAGGIIVQTFSTNRSEIYSALAPGLRSAGAVLGLKRIWPTLRTNGVRGRLRTRIFGDSDFTRIVDVTTRAIGFPHS